MTDIAPITPAQQAQVVARTEACIHQLARHFAVNLPPIAILFDLRGRSAGMYRVRLRQRQIRYNPYIFAKYFADNLATTVAHEVAHYAAHVIHGRRRIKPHGAEWRAIMAVLGADATRTCTYDFSGVPQRPQRRFAYRCGCTEHALSTRRHNNIQQRGWRYHCRQCGQALQCKR